jgi:lysylphosphatidylglycerol synthetase-like protein (DUF2156 family)
MNADMVSPCVAPLATFELPIRGRVIVASDLFLEAVPTPSSSAACQELAEALDAVEGPGAFVVAGNCFQLVPQPHGPAEAPSGAPPGPVEAFGAHGELRRALDRFLAGADRRAILLPGTRDRALCYDTSFAEAARSLGFSLALAVELDVQTASGSRRVRIEPGWRFDERHAFVDPTDPNDTPLGHHAAFELFPALAAGRSGWLDGVDRLQDPAGLPRFVASRLAYRRLGRFAWLLLVPIVVAIVARLPELWLFGVPSHLHGIARPLAQVLFTIAAELVALLGLLGLANHRLWSGPGSALLGPPSDRANDAAREAARELVGAGYAGLVTGHTLQAELGAVGRGFFANTGACGDVVEERRAVIGMPPVFMHDQQISFVEVEAGAEVHARLCLARRDAKAGTLLERLVVRPKPPLELSVVASYPGGASWPPLADPMRSRRLVRRFAAAIVGLVGLADIASALVPPQVRGRLHPYLGYVPLGASAFAGALDALAGVALVLVARGLRRGHRLAWAVAVAVLAATSLLHLVREGQVLEAVAALAVLAGLVWARDSFRSRYDPPSLRNGLLTLLGGAFGVTVFVTLVIEISVTFDKDHRSLPWTRAFLAAAERLVGIDSVSLPHAVTVFLDPALIAVGLGLAAVALLLAFRPVVDRARVGRAPFAVLGWPGPAGSPSPGSLGAALSHSASPVPGEPSFTRRGGAEVSPFDRARDVVIRRGSGTLDYFALRGDKQHFFDRDGVVAFAVHSGVCLVSPDPIGPAEERHRLWAAFRAFADEHGWTVAVLAAGQDWLPVYHHSGMRSLYIGDEAVVDVRTLSLQGGTKKGLRQAVNRIAKYGYTISFHDPATACPELAAELRSVMEKSRRGGVERGFSMTLGRIFDPLDRGLLLAVAHAPDGHAVAFCQFVPAPGIDGYSLDLMRRDPDDHPNGLLDFILVRTMEHLRESGRSRLGLNFAMMRAVLAGEAGDGISTKLERWVLKRMSDTMQIESLWRFNAKFDPEWLPRYVVWDSAEQSLVAALAIARAESFWELPLIGRFFVPSAPSAPSAPTPAPAPAAGAPAKPSDSPPAQSA